MSEIDIISQTYFDKVTIKGHRKVKDLNTGVTKLQKVIVYENVKCAVAKKSVPYAVNNDLTVVDNSHILFMTPEHVLTAGDSAEVTFQNGIQKELILGEPFYYSSHIECPLSIKERV